MRSPTRSEVGVKDWLACSSLLLGLKENPLCKETRFSLLRDCMSWTLQREVKSRRPTMEAPDRQKIPRFRAYWCSEGHFWLNLTNFDLILTNPDLFRPILRGGIDLFSPISTCFVSQYH